MKKLLLLCFSLAIFFSSIGQIRSVRGTVTSADDGTPLPGVSVVVKGSNSGTVTDADGKYTISVENGSSLLFTFIGLTTQEVQTLNSTVIDVQMKADVKQLSEVVVTAQGVERDKKALGYAVSTVGKEQLSARPVNDISRVLQGKVPGVVINPTGGLAGAGASINIRGYSSLTGSTQPLWVVDGVPFNSSTNQNSGFSTGGAAAASSRFLDLDPNTIESINVLKGLAATVLYGDQGRNGVIVVTTKSGNTRAGKPELSFQQATSVSSIASLPEFQNSYGAGFQQLYGPFFSNWGPHFDEIDSVGHPYQFLSDPSLQYAYPEYFFKRVPYQAAPNIGGFFRKGMVNNTSLNLSGGTGKLAYNSSIAFTKEEGYTPGNDLKRLNINNGFSASVTDNFTIRFSFLYSHTDVASPPLNVATGGGASFNGVPSLYANFLYTPRSIDILNWPFETPSPDYKSIFYRGSNDIPNARWIAKYAKETDVTDRFFNSANFTYDFSQKVNLTYRVGFDTYTERQTRGVNRGIGPTYPVVDRGVFQSSTIRSTIWNHDVILSAEHNFSEAVHVTASLGGNARNDYYDRDGHYSEGQSVFGTLTHSNFTSASSRDIAFGGLYISRRTEQQRYGVYSNVTADYKNYLFLNVSARNDWNSTHEKGHNSQFYPSASVALDATEAVPAIKTKSISYVKFRFGYGTSAGFAPPYSTRTVIGQNLRGYLPAGATTPIPEQSVGATTVSGLSRDIAGNKSLDPELQQELEAGVEAKFLDNRVGVDFTVYNRSTKNLITLAPVDAASGFTHTYVNVGKLENKGVELGITGTPVRAASGFQWDVTLNYTLVRPMVKALSASIDEVVLAGFATRGNFAIAGKPTNIMKGTVALRDANGNSIVGPDGLYLPDPTIQVIGNPNPDYFTTLINSFNLKGVTFSFQFDYRKGGKIYSSTASALIGRGVSKDVDFNHDLSYVLPGVRQAGFEDDGSTPHYIKNDIQISASDYGFNTQFFSDEVAVFDGTTIRLREVSLGYSLPTALVSKTPFRGASLSLTANNFWFNAVNVPKYVHFDSEVSSQGVGNGLGFDYLTGPSVKRIGAVLKLTF